MIARLIGLLFLTGAVWAGAEIMTKGPRDALGGLFASADAAAGKVEKNAAGASSTLRRSGERVDQAFRETERRYDEILDR